MRYYLHLLFIVLILVSPSISLAIADGTLVKGSNDRVYIIEAGQRRWITSAGVFEASNYNWNSIQTISDEVLNSIPLGSPISFQVSYKEMRCGWITDSTAHANCKADVSHASCTCETGFFRHDPVCTCLPGPEPPPPLPPPPPKVTSCEIPTRHIACAGAGVYDALDGCKISCGAPFKARCKDFVCSGNQLIKSTCWCE